MMSTTTTTVDAKARLKELCLAFKLPTLADKLGSGLVDCGYDDVLALVLEHFEQEASSRRERRVDRLRRASKLPPGKTMSTLEISRLPKPLAAKLRELCRAEFIERADNVLCFGLPGVGKSHVAAAIGHALVDRGHTVLFTSTFRLVQELLMAKRDLKLTRALRGLDAFDLLILDDIGYVQQDKDEVDVLFTLMAERYERRSMLITSNLVFSEWSKIFKDPMTTAAAIDRVVHHSVILEFAQVTTYRGEAAEKRRAVKGQVSIEAVGIPAEPSIK
jgi:DNA replication protein DnaC